MSTPAVKPLRAASRRSAQKPWLIISATLAQSETTKPSKFHSPRSMSVSTWRLPEAGMPSLSLNDDIYVRQPSLQTSSKGVR